jgi:TPR repeat protein
MTDKKQEISRKQSADKFGESDDFVMPIAPPTLPKGVVTGENNQPLSGKGARKINVGHPRAIPIWDSHARLDLDDPYSWSAAAADGNALAMALLGDALCWGGFAPHGVFRDIPIGLSLLEESSQLGHPLGLFMLSRAQRNIPGYRQPPSIADQTEIESVSAGFLDHRGEGGAVWWVAEAIAHQEGRVSPIDVNTQLALIQKSLDAGYTDAWTAYAFCLLEGVGITKDVKEGVKWLERAAEMENGTAMTHLANFYRNGLGGKADPAAALIWYEKAAQAGQDEALNSLGYCSRKGIGCKKNDIKAFEFYQKSAAFGNPSGLYNVGFCYEKGIGVRADKKLSSFWYAKAISLGHRKAEDGLKRVGRLFN